jgi:hypothetical protein
MAAKKTKRHHLPGVPSQCSQKQFAEIVTKKFGIRIYPAQISRALKQGMPDGGWGTGKLRTRTALEWWETHRVKQHPPAEEDLLARAAEARLRKQIDDARLSRTAADEAERLLDAKWILRADARLTVLGALRLHHGYVKKQMEKVLAARMLELVTTLDFSESQIMRLKEAVHRTGREIISAVETDCENY